MPALEKLSIDTPEQVALEFSLATVGSRFLALAIDTLIQVACAAVLFAGAGLAALAAQVRAGESSSWLAAVVVIGLFLIYYAYFAVYEQFFRRRGQLDGYVRVRAAGQIADRMRERLGITATIDNEQLLAELVAEYKTRGRFR